MDDKTGDSQARAELLAELLLAVGDAPFLLTHGIGKEQVFLVMVALDEKEIAELAASVGEAPLVIRMGRLRLVPLGLGVDDKPGQVGPGLYDVEKRRWTATVAVGRYSPMPPPEKVQP